MLKQLCITLLKQFLVRYKAQFHSEHTHLLLFLMAWGFFFDLHRSCT